MPTGSLVMAHIGSLCGIGIGVVFLFAGISKFVSRDEWQMVVNEVHVHPAILRLVPIAEVLLGVLSTARIATPIVPLVIAALLVVFSGWVLSALRRDVAPRCMCFGSRSQRPVSFRTLVRNVVLLVVAVGAALL